MGEKLEGRSVLITGASSGIGRATARALAQEGMRLALTARSGDRLAALATELGPRAWAYPADLTEPGAVEAVVAAATEDLDGLDVLFANAGAYLPGSVAEGHPEDWERMTALNVNAVLRAVRAVLPQMRQRRSGDILITNSIAGHEAIPGEAVYCATKHALTAFAQGLRREVLSDGIRVGSIAPGTVVNELWGVTDPVEIEARVAEHLGLRSEDIAEIVVFWLSRPRHVTLRDVVILPQAEDI